MKIKAKFFASCRDIVGRGEIELEVKEGTTAGDIERMFRRDFPKLSGYWDNLLVAVNAEYAEPQTALEDGDEIAFIPPVSGGWDV